MSPILASSKSHCALGTFFLIAAVTLCAQTSGTPATGNPHDWSHHHLIFSAPKDASQAAELEQEPRYQHQQAYRKAKAGVSDLSSTPSSDEQQSIGLTNTNGTTPGSMSEIRDALREKRKNAGLWGESLGGSSATVGPGNYPAKYSFSASGTPTTTNCAGGSAPDYVVFNTSVGGASTQASIVAYDNLYSGTCAGAIPQTYWAYNTSGTISRSVVLSPTGSKVAFMQSNGTTASLVVLTPSATTGTFTGQTTHSTSVTNVSASCSSLTNGSPIYGTGIPQGITVSNCTGTAPNSVVTLSAAATNSASETLSYSNATASAPASCSSPCSMTTVAFANGKNDTNSSPFYDYGSDALYVGDNNGNLHKFTTVFTGTPTEVSTNWPVAVSSNASDDLTSPVYDSKSGLVLFGDSAGYLYSVPAGGGSSNVIKSGQIGLGLGIVDAPLVDPTTETVYAFVGDDAKSAKCGSGSSSPCTAVYQFATSFSSGTTGNESITGLGSATTTLYTGAFDNTFYTNTGSTPVGNLYVCAFTASPSLAPKLYYLPFSSGVLASTATSGPLLTSAGAGCSPITEIDNAGTDLIFLSVTGSANITFSGTNTCTGACALSFNITSPPTSTSKAVDGIAAAGGASGMIIDNTGTGGGSQIYFTYLSSATSSITCPSPSNATSGGCAVQASQAALK